jgi:sugar phosphate isomerase/epimerase
MRRSPAPRRYDPRLSASAVSSWRWTLDEDLALWERVGVGHVGLSLRKLEAAGLPASAQRVHDAGLRVSNVVELGWWDLRDAGTWPRQTDRLLGAVDAARIAGGCLVLTTGPAGAMEWDEACDALDAALEPVRRAAAGAGVVLTIENTSPMRLDLSFVTTWRDTVDLARRLAVGACLEVNSCFAERGLGTAIRDAADVLAHVQVNDLVVGGLCTPDRAVPGDGDVPLERILGTVVGSGYPGAFEVEMVGPRIDAEGYEPALRRALEHLDGLLGRLAVVR